MTSDTPKENNGRTGLKSASYPKATSVLPTSAPQGTQASNALRNENRIIASGRYLKLNLNEAKRFVSIINGSSKEDHIVIETRDEDGNLCEYLEVFNNGHKKGKAWFAVRCGILRNHGNVHHAYIKGQMKTRRLILVSEEGNQIANFELEVEQMSSNNLTSTGLRASSNDERMIWTKDGVPLE